MAWTDFAHVLFVIVTIVVDVSQIMLSYFVVEVRIESEDQLAVSRVSQPRRLLRVLLFVLSPSVISLLSCIFFISKVHRNGANANSHTNFPCNVSQRPGSKSAGYSKTKKKKYASCLTWVMSPVFFTFCN